MMCNSNNMRVQCYIINYYVENIITILLCRKGVITNTTSSYYKIKKTSFLSVVVIC